MATDLYYIVSGDPQMARGLSAIVEGAYPGKVRLFSGSSDCLSALRSQVDDRELTIIVDGVLEDVAPLNLVGAIRHINPHVGIVLTVSPADDVVTERAMLAGARAVVERTAIDVDLLPSVQRVAVTTTRGSSGQAVHDSGGGDGAIVAFVGARGGAGRSTLSALSAWTASTTYGIDVALVDFDLQFGDLGFLFDVSPRSTLVDLVNYLAGGQVNPKDMGVQLNDSLTLYSPSPQPEHAELVAPRIGQVLSNLRKNHELVVVNTGPFWTTFHAELFESTDAAIFVFDQTGVGVRATVQAKGLAQKLGVPDGRIAYVLNREKPKGGLSAVDAAMALKVPSVTTVPDGGSALASYADAGDIAGLVANSAPVVAAVDKVLHSVFDIVGRRMPAPVATAKKSRLFGGR